MADPVSPTGSSTEGKEAYHSDEKAAYSKDAPIGYDSGDVEQGESNAEEFVETKELKYCSPRRI